MADMGIGVVLLLFVLYGMRHGIWKELVGLLAFAAACFAAKEGYREAAIQLHDRAGIPMTAGYAVGAALCWCAVYFALAFVGMLLFRWLRGTPAEKIEKAADAAAGRVAGEPARGPVTLITSPLPTRKRTFYWFDKLGGGALGLAKGLVLATLVIVVGKVLWVNGPLAEPLEGTRAVALYRAYVDPELSRMPEFRIVKGLKDLNALAAYLRDRPGEIDRALAHEEFRTLREHEGVKELAKDKELQELFTDRKLVDLLWHPKVRALLRDPKVREVLADIDYRAVLESVKAEAPPDGAAASGPADPGARPPSPPR